MHIYTVIKEKVQSILTERKQYVFKRDLDDDSDGAHLTSRQKKKQKKTSDRQMLP